MDIGDYVMPTESGLADVEAAADTKPVYNFSILEYNPLADGGAGQYREVDQTVHYKHALEQTRLYERAAIADGLVAVTYLVQPATIAAKILAGARFLKAGGDTETTADVGAGTTKAREQRQWGM